jgi:hypothetical protein
MQQNGHLQLLMRWLMIRCRCMLVPVNTTTCKHTHYREGGKVQRYC